jgi:four helix bundle protein
MSDEFTNQTTNTNRKPQSYRDLLVWQKSIALAKAIYKLTAEFPSEEKFGLISQMRRAAVSVPSNIAEGQARHTTGEFILFISHAEGSLAELDTQLTLATELNFLTTAQAEPCAGSIFELRRMLNGLRRKISGQKSVTPNSKLAARS